jgi:hypothetical protein
MDRRIGDESEADLVGVGVLACLGQYDDALATEEIYCAEVHDKQAALAAVNFAVEGCAELWRTCIVDLAAGCDDDHFLMTLVLRHGKGTARLR